MKKRLFKRLGGKRRGFTLIELLIVLSILAVLAAVVVLALTGFIGRGESQACQTDHRSLQSAVLAFWTEAGAWPCTVQPTDGTYEPINWAADDGTGNTFAPYYVLEAPDTDADCVWSVDKHGIVGTDQDGGVGEGTCPCFDDVPNDAVAAWGWPAP